MKSLLLATVLAVASILPAKAAVIQIVPVDPKTTDFRTGLPATVPAIIIVGKIEIGDAAKFREAAAKVPNYSIVAMASNGGKTFEAIEIGEITRKRGFATVVYDGHYCVSACGLIWLAGTSDSPPPRPPSDFTPPSTPASATKTVMAMRRWVPTSRASVTATTPSSTPPTNHPTKSSGSAPSQSNTASRGASCPEINGAT